MKCEIMIDENCEEKVVIFAREHSSLVKQICEFVEERQTGLVGYREREIVLLSPDDIYCVTVLDGKVYAVCKNEKLLLKDRLYVLEEKLPRSFVKINQSCLANIKLIKGFDASISGTLKVKFANGHVDYVSRRQMKEVRERIGI